MALYASWVHGNTLTVETPGNLQSIGRLGFGTDARITAGTGSWFHIAIPSPVISNNIRTRIQTQFFLYQLDNGTVTSVHIYDGSNKIQEFNGLSLSGNHLTAIDASNRFTLRVPHSVLWGMSISFFCQANAATPAHLIVASAGGDFNS